MKILGLSAFYHDAAAAILVDGVIKAAAQEERFTRKKHDSGFPKHAIQFCLEETALSLSDLDAVVFYDKPLLKFERLLETYYGFAPRGLASFIQSMPVWLREKMFLKRILRESLGEIDVTSAKQVKLLFPEHHLSHAASAFYPSPFDHAAIVTIDGVGEWTTASICQGSGKDITILKELKFPHSIGLLYSAFTYYLGFKVNSGEYKLMGLAPYGNEGPETEAFVATIKSELITLYKDGSVWLNQKYFNYATGLRMARDAKWKKLFGFARRDSETPIGQHHCNLALAIQKVTEEAVMNLAKHAREITGSENLCLAGGVALNCVANGKLRNSGIFQDIYIQPASGDAGGAIGGALAAYHIKFDQPRQVTLPDGMSGAYLGNAIDDKSVLKVHHRYQAVSKKYSDDELYPQVAGLLATGKIVGWVQGKMEFGPRALGNRSILGDPRSGDMQKRLNLSIKYRESFRPFAPAILAEEVDQCFELNGTSPYMLLVDQVKGTLLQEKPADYDQRDLAGKLYFERSTLPAITHIDNSARIQTVHQETNPRFHSLLTAFQRQTHCPVLINTSFNVRGEPIVSSAEDAYRCFMRTEMEVLVINNHVFMKADQPEFADKENWQEAFTLD